MMLLIYAFLNITESFCQESMRLLPLCSTLVITSPVRTQKKNIASHFRERDPERGRSRAFTRDIYPSGHFYKSFRLRRAALMCSAVCQSALRRLAFFRKDRQSARKTFLYLRIHCQNYFKMSTMCTTGERKPTFG